MCIDKKLPDKLIFECSLQELLEIVTGAARWFQSEVNKDIYCDDPKRVIMAYAALLELRRHLSDAIDAVQPHVSLVYMKEKDGQKKS
jgi:hypothetical protein